MSLTARERMAICFVFICVPLGIAHVWAMVYRPDLLPEPITMRYIWVAGVIVMAGLMSFTKTLFNKNIGGSLLVLVLGPIPVLVLALYGIWYKISPLKEK